MQELRLPWIILFGTLSLVIHALVIDEWEMKRDHKLAIQICSWVLCGGLGIACAFALLRLRKLFDGFMWGILCFTAAMFALATHQDINYEVILIIWGVAIIILGTCGLCFVAHEEKLDTHTFLYLLSVSIALGGGVLFSMWHDLIIAATGFIVVIWTVTLPFMLVIWKETDSIEWPAASFLVAVALTVGAAVCIFEKHTFILMLNSWFLQLFVWGAWIIYSCKK